MPDSHFRRGQSVRPGQPAGERSSVLAHRIAVAAGDRPADLVLRGARVLSVIPELKITDLGLIDTVKFAKTPLEVAPG